MSVLPLFVCLLAIVSIDAWNSGICNHPASIFPLFYASSTNRCYALITIKMNWYDAEKFCKILDEKAFLTVISSNRELEWISDNIRNAPGYTSIESYWTGGRRKNGVWEWPEFGTWVSMRSPPWKLGEPNGSGSGVMLKYTFNRSIRWRFHDGDRTKKHYFICEIDKSDWGSASSAKFRLASAGGPVKTGTDV